MFANLAKKSSPKLLPEMREKFRFNFNIYGDFYHDLYYDKFTEFGKIEITLMGVILPKKLKIIWVERGCNPSHVWWGVKSC